MNRFSRFKAEKEKNPVTRYTAKPTGLEHLELETTDEASIADIAGSAPGKDLQAEATDIVREKKKARRMLHEEGMSATNSKEKFKPQLKQPFADSTDDRFCEMMCKAMEGDSVRANQETLKLIEDRRAAKWAHIAQLEARQERSTSESGKALLQKQIDISLAFLGKIDDEELVLR